MGDCTVEFLMYKQSMTYRWFSFEHQTYGPEIYNPQQCSFFSFWNSSILAESESHVGITDSLFQINYSITNAWCTSVQAMVATENDKAHAIRRHHNISSIPTNAEPNPWAGVFLHTNLKWTYTFIHFYSIYYNFFFLEFTMSFFYPTNSGSFFNLYNVTCNNPN